MKTFIAFSGGVESTTMCLLYGKGATAVFTDTGSEHKAMYARINAMESYLTKHHKGDFKLIRLPTQRMAQVQKSYTLLQAHGLQNAGVRR